MRDNGNSASSLEAPLRVKRVLIANCYFDDSRQPIRRAQKIPQAVGPLYLAGFFHPKLCEVRCYTELASGPLKDQQMLGWPDMIVLTGLTNSFDRMLHLTAYARSKNPRIIVVAGGPAVRALPALASRYFDYCCHGDIEEMREVIVDTFGEAYTSDEAIPRYDLGYWLGSLGYIESSRYCNFRCSFCSLTGEGHSYQTYDLNYIRQQILAAGKRKRIFFLDNNFYGSDRNQFRSRIELLNEMRSEKQFRSWSALVTSDFYSREENLFAAKSSGCELLFTGVESFDSAWVQSCNKTQNRSDSQVQLIKRCLESGIVFSYGLIFDITTRCVEELQRELDFITSTPEIPLPSFITLAIPLLGTPYFKQALEKGSILPNTKLRDMDGTTLLQQPIDAPCKVVQFVADLQRLWGYRQRVAKHSIEFLKRYRMKLNAEQLSIAVGQGVLLCAPRLSTSFSSGDWLKRCKRRTYVSTTEPLDEVYKPAFRVESRFEHYFKPTMVTDFAGQLHEDLRDSAVLRSTTDADVVQQRPSRINAGKTLSVLDEGKRR
jgi:radical SAM superfamily enzyme YgiQ (UPF0313 family)